MPSFLRLLSAVDETGTRSRRVVSLMKPSTWPYWVMKLSCANSLSCFSCSVIMGEGVRRCARCGDLGFRSQWILP